MARPAPATQRDVARLAGVSQGTASVVLNGKELSVGISDATRDRIMRAAEHLDYSPNVMARGLKSLRHFAIGVSSTSTDPSNGAGQSWMTADYYGTFLLKGIMGAAHGAGYNVTMFHKNWVDAKKSAAGFRGQGIDGYVIIAPLPESDMVSGLASIGVPVVVISSSSEQHGVPSVDVDNARGASLAVEHLLSLGHTRIAHMMEGLQLFDTRIRRDSFIKTLADAGVPLPPEYVMDAAPDIYKRGRELLTLPERPTAVFTTDDRIAVGLMQAARDLGIRVPEDLSIVGFDDSPAATMTIPQLTTVRQPLVPMAEKAASLLIALVEGEQVANKTYWFEPELIVRGTTMPPV